MFNSLRVRLTVILIGLAVGPLLIAGIILVQRSLATERNRAYLLQGQVAQNVSTAIESYVQDIVVDLASLGSSISGLAQPDRAQQLSLMLGMLSTGSNQDAFEELILLDSSGREQVRLSRQEIVPSSELGNRAGLEEFEIPRTTRNTYFSPVRLDETTGKNLIIISIPLYEPRSVQLTGVLVANVDFATISRLLSQAQVGEGQTIYVTDSAGNVVAHENRTMALQGLNIALPATADTQRGLDGTTVVLAVRKIELENQILFVVAEQPNSQALQLAYTTILTTGFVVVGAILLALTFGFLAVRQIIQPIQGLASSAERIASGDLTHQASILRQDEIGLLAKSFNSMTAQLRDFVGTLEKRVAERTAEMESARQVSDKRAQNLQTIAEIARYISTEKDLEKLLPLITRNVSDRFGFYHVGIFLLDETGKHAVLRASNSPGGQTMLRLKHSLEVGQKGIVGYVTGSGSPRVALNTGEDSVYFNNPNLPDTRSEMAVPLSTRGKIIGALDVQSTEANAFSDADVAILSLLADQIAIAIDNVQLLKESQGALAESQAVFREYLAAAWQDKMGTGIIGYHQTLSGGRALTESSLSELEKNETGEERVIKIPIRVRDQEIGVLNIRPISADKNWNEDDLAVVQAVAERLGLTLDNARLFEETSSRASRERFVTEITSKIRASNDPQEMMKTAVQELEHLLGATRVEIVSQRNDPPPD